MRSCLRRRFYTMALRALGPLELGGMAEQALMALPRPTPSAASGADQGHFLAASQVQGL